MWSCKLDFHFLKAKATVSAQFEPRLTSWYNQPYTGKIIYRYVSCGQFKKRKKSRIGSHWLTWRVRIIEWCQKMKRICRSNLIHNPVFRALRWDNPQVKHLKRVDNPRVQSLTTPSFKAQRRDKPWVQSEITPWF